MDRNPFIKANGQGDHAMKADTTAHNRFLITLVWFFILLGGIAPYGYATDYYVDIVNGCDVAGGACAAAGDGSQAMPWKTIHHALSILTSPAAGDILYVLPGTYSIGNGETDLALTVPNNLTIKGQPLGEPIIDGSGATAANWLDNGFVFISSTTGRIEGLTIQNFSNGIGVYNSYPEILNNILVDNAIGIYVAANMADASPTIINNLIYEYTASAMSYGIAIYGVSTGGTNSSEIYHNTIDGGTADGIYFDTDVELFTVDVRYNNITDFGGYAVNHVDPSLNAGSAVSYNNVYGNGNTYSTSLTTYLADNIAVDPGYTDPASGDFHLPQTSGAVDQIPAAAGDMVTYDQEGKSRILPYDIGCYEFADMYTLTVTVSGTGTVTSGILDINCPGDCTETAVMGTIFQLTPTAGAGYQFDHWLVDGTAQDVNPIDVTMTSDILIETVFTPSDLPEHTADRQIFPAGTGSLRILADNFFAPTLADHTLSHWLVRREDRKSYKNDDYDSSFTVDTGLATGLTAHIVKGLTTGMEYVWMVGYEDADGTITWSDEFRFTVGDTAPIATVTTSGGTLLENYRMISFPIWTLQSLPDLLTVDCDPVAIRLGTWDPVVQSYIECGPGLKVAPGRSFWVLSRDGLSKTPAGIAVTTALEVEVALQQGWNMIAVPNNQAYTWNDVQLLESDTQGGVLFGPAAIGSLADSTYIDPVLWRWDNGTYASDATTMVPFEGYWVRANRTNLFLKFPNAAVAAAGLLSERTSVGMEKSSARRQSAARIWETPPMPMGNTSSEADKGGCFLTTFLHNIP